MVFPLDHKKMAEEGKGQRVRGKEYVFGKSREGVRREGGERSGKGRGECGGPGEDRGEKREREKRGKKIRRERDTI